MRAEQAEQLRHAVLEVLATRFPTALPPGGIRRRIAMDAAVDFGYSDEELNAALEFLRQEKLVFFTQDPLGASKYWGSTSEGVKACERGR